MRGKFFTALLFLGMIMWAMPVVQVSADSMHSHEMVSPFQKHEHGNHPHCDLSKRFDSPVFCPHRKNRGNLDQTIIGVYCDGKPSGALPSTGSVLAKDFSSTDTGFVFGPFTGSSLYSLPSFSMGFLLSDPPYHPPKSV